MKDKHWGMFPFRKISVKLMLVFMLFIALPLAINGMLIFSKTRNVMEKDIMSFAQNTLFFVDTNVANLMRQYDARLLEIYSRRDIFTELYRMRTNPDADLLSAEVTVNDELSKFLYGHAYLDAAYILSGGGQTYFAAKNGVYDPGPVDRFRQTEGLQDRIAALNGKGLWFSLGDGGTEQLYFARTIKNIFKDFSPVGILLVRVDAEGLSRIFSETYLPDQSFLSVYNEQEQMVYYRGASPAEFGRFPRAFPQELAQAREGTISMELNGEPYAAFHRTSAYKNWKYVEYVPRSQLTSQIFAIRRYWIFITLLSFLFLIVMTVLVSQYVTNPIRKLARAMGKLKNGNLDAVVSVRSKDEVGLLGNSFNTMREQIKQLIHDVQVAGNKEKEAEIQALKAQFNPHFLYNSLGAVNWKAIRAGQLEISDMITDLSDILRYSLDKNGGDLVTVREDVRWLKKYVNLQKARFDYDFEAVFTVDPFAADRRIHKLLLQPLIENSIIHGFGQGSAGGLILVSIMVKGGDIVMEVSDNGRGMEEEKAAAIRGGTGGGLGLRNVQDRLRLYYGDEYGMMVESEPGNGTKIAIRMPLAEREQAEEGQQLA